MINFNNYKSITIKIGSSLIIDSANYQVRQSWLESIAKEILDLQKRNINITLVISGSIAFACKELKQNRSQLSLNKLQAMASFGQALLIEKLRSIFNKVNLNIAQILITAEDCHNRKRYLNIKNTISKLQELNIIPIINENDSVSTDEIGFGDNDQLSAIIAQSIESDLLIILSDISGLYDKNPSDNSDAKLIKKIKKITKSIMSMASDSTSHFGRGGMRSKIMAANIATKGGADVIISSGKIINSLSHIETTSSYSFFCAIQTTLSARKKWLSNLKSKGSLIIDAGAKDAILRKKSLLPIGIIKTTGTYKRGDIVEVIFANKKIAQGIVNFDSKDIEKIIGKNSQEIKDIIGFPINTAIHTDNMV